MGQPPAPTVDCRRTACIALTFDDGPGPYTDQIRRTLQDNGARATFFVIGRSAEADKGAVARLHAAGMEVGDHTYSHQSLAHMATAVQQREVGRAADVVEQAAGARPYLLRPPYGALGASTLHLGWPVVTWDVDTQDWVNRNASVTTQRALAGARPGAIILMHDIQPSTAAALPGIVTELKRRGYTLVTVNDILGGARADGRAHERGLVRPQPRPIAPAATQDATPGAPPTAPAPSAPAPTPPAPTVTSPAASTPPPSGPTTQPARQPGTSHPSTHSRGRPGNAPGLAKPPGSDAARTRQPVTPKIPRPQTKTKGAQ